MIRRAAVAIALLAGLLATEVRAQGFVGNIVTGDASGTYIQIGRDLAAMGAECGLELNVRESAGSVENMLAVRDRRSTQLGMVQSDVLEYFQTFQSDDPAIRRATQGIRVAFPLYDEEVHVLARREITGLAGLTGRRVAVGLEQSGTFVTAETILDLAEVEPAATLPIGPAAALDALLAGEIDALFYVVGAPAAFFRSERIDPEAFHLLPLTGPVLTAVYTPAVIAVGTYGFVTEPVAVVAVKAILVTYDFDPGRGAYHAASCGLVADVSHLMVTRLERLRAEGHPKWRSVDMTALPRGWEVSDCVLDGLAPDYAFRCERPDGTVVDEGEQAPAADANQRFLQGVCARIGC